MSATIVRDGTDPAKNISPGSRGYAPSSAALQAIGAQPRITLRRPTKQASYELCNHAKAYLEGGKLASGYDFLHSLLAAGMSISKPETPYLGFLAPPAYIAFASSLIVYPKVTTQTRLRDTRNGSDAALRYLRCIHNTIDGPAYPTIRKALSFPKENNRRRGLGYRSAAGSRSPELGSDIDSIAGEAANAQSLWARAEDFWHVVGWSFNCSVLHKKRWRRWKVWLATTIDFLERDLDFCEAKNKQEGSARQDSLQESLLWHYIVGNTDSANRGARRRMVKAILAAASPESLKDYPEVWDQETAGPPRNKADGQPLADVDYEIGKIGDYDSDVQLQSDVDDTDGDEREVFSAGEGVHNTDDAVKSLGGIDAVNLRQRLISLLATAAAYMPGQFTTVSDLFDNILEDFNQLPIMSFKLLLTTSTMAPRYQLAFQTNLLLPMISGKIPDHFNYEPSQETLESMLFPVRAVTQSFATNAKISLILEQIFMYMLDQGAITASDTLRQSIETGIEARHAAYGTSRGKKGNVLEEGLAKSVMHAASKRLLCLLEVLSFAEGKPPRPLDPKDMLSSFMTGSSLSSAPESDTDEED